MLEVLTGEASKGYKKKILVQKKNQCINMHKRKGFIMIDGFNITHMILCMLILKQ